MYTDIVKTADWYSEEENFYKKWNAIRKQNATDHEWYEGSSDFTIYCTDGEITKAEAIQ